MTTDLMTVDQVAAYLQLNKLTVYRYIREGRIPAARLGKAYRIRKADVDAFLEQNTVRGQTRTSARPGRPARPAGPRESRVAAEEIAVAPGRREVPEPHPEININPMEWVIRGLH